MKKKKQIFDKDLKMPHLFREDLENIEEIIKKELKPSGYKLESESFEYSSVIEVKNSTKQTNHFRIQAYTPDVFIDLTNKKAFIHADDDSVNTLGAINKIMDIVAKRERKFLWYTSRIGTLFAPSLAVGSFLSLILLHLIDWEYAIAILVLSVTWSGVIIYSEEYQFSIVGFAYLEDRPDFFSRNKDQIATGIIVGIIVSVVSILATLFFAGILKLK